MFLINKSFIIGAAVSVAVHCLLLGGFENTTAPVVIHPEKIISVSLVEKKSQKVALPCGEQQRPQEEKKKPVQKKRQIKKVTSMPIIQEKTAEVEAIPIKPAEPEEKEAIAELEEKAEESTSDLTVTKETALKSASAGEEQELNASSVAENNVGTSEVINSEIPARAISVPEPRYPRVARMARQEGTVVFEITVTENGEASEIKIVSSSGFSRLDKEALLAVQKGSFIPAERNGIRVASVLPLKIRFALTN